MVGNIICSGKMFVMLLVVNIILNKLYPTGSPFSNAEIPVIKPNAAEKGII